MTKSELIKLVDRHDRRQREFDMRVKGESSIPPIRGEQKQEPTLYSGDTHTGKRIDVKA